MSKLLGIENWLNQYVENLSSGMKLKLALARTLLLEREILFFNEPTIGLDVKTVNLFIDIVKNIESTLIFISHDLYIVEKLCDRIAFINKGKIFKIGAQKEIIEEIGPGTLAEIFLDNNKQELIYNLRKFNFEIENIKNKNSICVCLKKKTDYKNLLDLLRNYEILKIKEIETSLEDLFLKKY